MARLLSLKPSDAPLGAIALIPICLSAFCLPLAHSLSERSFYVPVILFLICFMFFSAALLLSVGSIMLEKSKLFGILGIAIAVTTLRIEPMTRYFLVPISFYLPIAIVALLTILGFRIWSRKYKPFSSQ